MTVDSAVIESHHLRVFSTHGGGCETHEFAAVASGGWMESSPVQINVYIAHESRDDPCRALLSPQLRFDLSPLRRAYQNAYGTQPGELVIRLTEAAPMGHAPILVTYRF
jgi:hypothetical protein